MVHLFAIVFPIFGRAPRPAAWSDGPGLATTHRARGRHDRPTHTAKADGLALGTSSADYLRLRDCVRPERHFGRRFSSTCRPCPINHRMASEREGLWGSLARQRSLASLKSRPERRHRAHHRHPDDREPGRAVRLRGLHGEPSERGRHQHRRRVHSVATTGTSWPGLVGSKSAKQNKVLAKPQTAICSWRELRRQLPH